MIIRLNTTPLGGTIWYVSTDDGQYDAVSEDQLAAVMRVAQHMEEDLREKKAPADLTTDEAVALLRQRLMAPPPESHHYCDYSKCSGHPRINNYCSSQRREDNGD